MTAEHHIVSFALRCDPAALDDLVPWLRNLPGAEIGVQDAESGKVAMVMEASDENIITRTLAEIQLRPGIASAALAYQHILTADDDEPATRKESQT